LGHTDGSDTMSVAERATLMSRRQERGSDYRLPRRGARHRSMVRAGVVLCSLLAATGALIFAIGLRDWRTHLESAHWPTTEAEIIASRITKRFVPPGRYSSGGATYVREISFRYSVSGTTYTSDAALPVTMPPVQNDAPSRESTLSAQSGERLMVRYDPSDPRSVVVYPEQALAAPLAIVMGAVLAIVCSLFVLALRSWLTKAGS